MRTAKNRLLSAISRLNNAEKYLSYLLNKREKDDEKGKTFDPELVDIFFNNQNEILQIKDSFSDFTL